MIRKCRVAYHSGRIHVECIHAERHKGLHFSDVRHVYWDDENKLSSRCGDWSTEGIRCHREESHLGYHTDPYEGGSLWGDPVQVRAEIMTARVYVGNAVWLRDVEVVEPITLEPVPLPPRTYAERKKRRH